MSHHTQLFGSSQGSNGLPATSVWVPREAPADRRATIDDLKAALRPPSAEPSAPTTSPDCDAEANPFRRLWDLGYRALLPIIPPGATIATGSTIKAGSVGKIPGRSNAEGLWVGFPKWTSHETSEADLDAWHGMGAGVGIRCGVDVIGLDIDATDPETAEQIERKAVEMLGAAPMRVGNWPKRLLLYRCREPIGSRALSFPEGEGAGRVELPRQFVAEGIHPKTRKPYEWRRPLYSHETLAVVDRAKLDGLFSALEAMLPKARDSGTTTPGKTPDQAALRGDPETVRRAIEALPNDRETFPDRNDYITTGYAIKAALPDDDAEAYELWTAWAEKYEDANPDDWAKDWASMRPPFHVGAGYLYHLADKHSGGAFTFASVYLEPEADEAVSVDPPTQTQRRREPLIIRGPIEPAAIPTRRWVVAPWLPLGDVVQCVGEPGISKSTFAIRVALVIASGDEGFFRGHKADGGPISPERLHRAGPVILYNAEDREDEIQRRIAAAQRHYGIEQTHPIIAWSGVDHGTLHILRRDGEHGALKPADSARRLEEMIRQYRPALVVLDPQISLCAGASENSNDDVDALFQYLAELATKYRTCVLVIHHTSKASRDAAGDMGAGRGAFAGAGKVRAYITLTNVRGDRDDDEKRWIASYGEDLIRLDFAKVSHDRKPKTPIVFQRLSVPVGNGEGVASGAADAFADHDPLEAQRLKGDYAPVLEIVDMDVCRAKPAEKRNANAVAMAEIVDRYMGAEDEVQLSHIADTLGAAMREAGLINAKVRSRVTGEITAALAPGVDILSNDRSVRIAATRTKGGTTAPWILRRTAPDKGQGVFQ